MTFSIPSATLNRPMSYSSLKCSMANLRMRKSIDEVSFLNQTALTLQKKFVSLKPTHFAVQKSIFNILLQKMLGLVNGEIFTLHTTEPIAVRSLLERLKHTGLVSRYGEGPLYSDYPKFNYVGIYHTVQKNDRHDTSHTAWGYSFLEDSSELAFSKALGELVERHASYHLPHSKSVTYPILKHGDASFLYPHIPKFTAHQKPRNKNFVSSASDMQNMLGFRAKSLTGDRKRFLPFEAFYWGPYSHNEQKIFAHPTTSGSGGGKTISEATLSALGELIERDHFLLYWLSGIKPKRLENKAVPGSFGEYIRLCEQNYDLEIHFLDTSHDIAVVSCVCVIIDPVLNLIAMGSKVGTDGITVLKGAYLEAMAVLTSIRKQNKAFPEHKLKEVLTHKVFTSPVGHTDRLNLYSSRYGIDLIRKHFLGGESLSFEQFSKDNQVFSSEEEKLVYLVKEINALVEQHGPGYHAYIHIFESRWLAELKYHAVHVFIPQFLKLYLSENFAAPLSDRLTEFGKKHGKSIISEKNLNPLPHFFP